MAPHGCQLTIRLAKGIKRVSRQDDDGPGKAEVFDHPPDLDFRNTSVQSVNQCALTMKNFMDEESISKNELDHFGLVEPDFYGLSGQIHFHSGSHSCAEAARYFTDESRNQAGAGATGINSADSCADVHADRREACFRESRVVAGPDKVLSDNGRVSFCCKVDDSPTDQPEDQDLAFSTRKKGGKDCHPPLSVQLDALKPPHNGFEERSRSFTVDTRSGQHEVQGMEFADIMLRKSRNRDRNREKTSFFVDVQGNKASYLSTDERIAGKQAVSPKPAMRGGGVLSSSQPKVEVDGGDDRTTHAEGKVGRRTRVFAAKKPAGVCDPSLDAGIGADPASVHKCLSTAIPAVSESTLGVHIDGRPSLGTSSSATLPGSCAGLDNCAPTARGLKHEFSQEAKGCASSGTRAPHRSPCVSGERPEFFGRMREQRKEEKYFVHVNSPAETSIHSFGVVERSPEDVAGDDDLVDSMLRDSEVMEIFKDAALGEAVEHIEKSLNISEELGPSCSNEAPGYGDQATCATSRRQHVSDFNEQELKKQSPASEEVTPLVDKASAVLLDSNRRVRNADDNAGVHNPLNMSAALVGGGLPGLKVFNDSTPSGIREEEECACDSRHVDSVVPEYSEERLATRTPGSHAVQGETADTCPTSQEKQGTGDVGTITNQAVDEELTGIVDKFARIFTEESQRKELGNETPHTHPVPDVVEHISSRNGFSGLLGEHSAAIHRTSRARVTRAGPHSKQIPEDVIILVDDDEDEAEGDVGGHDDDNNDSDDYLSDHNDSTSGSDDEGYESDATSSRKVSDAAQHMSRRQGVRHNSSNISAVPSQPAEDSDDDCQVISEMPPRQRQAGFVARRTFQYPITVDEDTAGKDPKNSSGSGSDSDCEVLDGSQGDIRRQWEEAALRRRTSSGLKSEGSNVGRGAASDLRSHGPRSRHDGNATAPQPVAGDREQHSSKHHHVRAESVATSTDTDLGETGEKPWSAEGIQTGLGEFDINGNERGPLNTGINQAGPENAVPSAEPASTDEVLVGCLTSKAPIASADAETIAPLSEKSCEQDNKVKDEASQLDTHGCKEAWELAVAVESLAEGPVDREKLKETEEFRQANNEEWARRNIELQRQELQSSEAQKLKKRKRAEADRKLEMESRQKQRVEEIRQFQQQEEVNIGLKDEIRGKVRGRLEALAKGCVDMAMLLRRLGVPMEGGISPTSQQVSASYKRALLKFHPDRASVPVNGDPGSQVEAEETFKLISRLKNSLPLVAAPSRATISGRYFNF